jgi:hypothetical protein
MMQKTLYAAEKQAFSNFSISSGGVTQDTWELDLQQARV